MSVKTQIVAEYGQRIGTDANTLDGEKVNFCDYLYYVVDVIKTKESDNG